MTVESITLKVEVRDVIEAGAWYEKVLNARTSDPEEYAEGCRCIDIEWEFFRISLNETDRYSKQNMPLANRYTSLRFVVNRSHIERVASLDLDIEDDYLSNEQDARYIALKDPDGNSIHLTCYDDFTVRRFARRAP
jgi:hypothetical protein